MELLKYFLSGLVQLASRSVVMTMLVALTIYLVWPMLTAGVFQGMVNANLIPDSIDFMQAYQLAIVPSVLAMLSSIRFIRR